MKIYEVGGAVRDRLLGRPVADRDWVVVGGSPEEMLAQGYRQVGRDFPVFLHPETHEEYALARLERKQGQGYRGFAFDTAPGVTLEEDLARRDVTINAMARDDAGRIIDPYGGQKDLAAGVLRHITPAFAEDPLRVLRVARFAARFGFCIAPETLTLMQQLAGSGELLTLSPERVWRELERALMEAHPSRFLQVLRDCGALAPLLPEIDGLFGQARCPGDQSPRDAGDHLLQNLALAAQAGLGLPVRFALLALIPCDDASGTEPALRQAEQICHRLRAPVALVETALTLVREQSALRGACALEVEEVVALLERVDAFRRGDRFEDVLCACAVDARAPVLLDYAPAVRMRVALAACRTAKPDAEVLASKDGAQIKAALHTARVATVARAEAG